MAHGDMLEEDAVLQDGLGRDAGPVADDGIGADLGALLDGRAFADEAGCLSIALESTENGRRAIVRAGRDWLERGSWT